jgi:hypothetical protein
MNAPYVWVVATACVVMGTAGVSDHNGSMQDQSLNLEAARRMVSGSTEARTLGAIDLSGLEFAREIQLGEGRRLIVVSASGAGGLAAFRADGSLLQTMATGAITMIQLFDPDEDGVSEVIVEEVEGKGTGVLMKSFVLLVAGRERLTEAWRQPSYRREARSDPAAPSASAPLEIHNFLRFDRSGAGRPARMTYLLGPQGGCSFRERVFELTERGLHQVPNTPDPGSGNTTCR